MSAKRKKPSSATSSDAGRTDAYGKELDDAEDNGLDALEAEEVAKDEAELDAKAKERRTPVKVDLGQSPTWWAPVMVGLMVAGLVWMVVYYLSNFEYPVKALGAWNMGVGFVLIMAGFMMTTRWK